MQPEDFDFQAIALDTSIFDRNGLNLEGGLLFRLKQFKESPITVLLSEIVYHEILKHLFEEGDKAQELINRAIREAKKVFRKTDEDIESVSQILSPIVNVQNFQKQRLDEFVSLTGANIISCENIESVSEIFKRYFSCRPPFSASGKKKEEFPDAFAMFGIIHWARTHDARVLVVSTDPDWKAFFEDNPNFEVMEDLSMAIAVFQPANVALSLRSLLANCLPHGRSDKIYRYIWSSIETYLDGLCLHPDADSQFYFEADVARIILENLSFPDLNSASITIIEYSKSSVVLEIDVLIAYSCECDFSFSVYDSVDKEHIGMGSSAVIQKDEVFSQLLLTFEGDFLKSENDYEIVGCEVVFFPASVDFGLVEPDWCGTDIEY